MKPGAKLKIDFLPILGIIGLLFVILYFLLANFTGDSADQSNPKDPYYLFYKLYRKLDYKLTDHNLRTLPQLKGDLIIYLNYDNDERKLTSSLMNLINHWVNKGGTLFIAGIKDDQDPIRSSKLSTYPVKSIYVDKLYAETEQPSNKPILNLKGIYLKHLSIYNVSDKESIILYSEHGPLLYRSIKGAGSIFVLSDSTLLTNEYLRKDNAAIFFNKLLRPYFSKRIYIIREGSLGNRKTFPLLTLLFKDKLLFISLQLLWIMGLFIAWQGKRFGEPQLLDPYARRTLSEHLKAIGYFYQKTNSLGIVDEINCDYFKYMLNKITGLQFRDSLRPEDIEKIKKHLDSSASGFSNEQIVNSFKKDATITLNRLHNKQNLQDSILKSLTKAKNKK